MARSIGDADEDWGFIRVLSELRSRGRPGGLPPMNRQGGNGEQHRRHSEFQQHVEQADKALHSRHQRPN